MGYSIDVGKLIFSSLTYIIRGTTFIAMGHHSLIYALCVNVGVRRDQIEDQLFPISALTKRKILCFKKVGGGDEEAGPNPPTSLVAPTAVVLGVLGLIKF